ncbi:MAG: hypothetical protein KC589_06760 [Nanoarchaeota archaeon]|nr:hypothetical protein [Nanoarchaeota archaeon]
MTIKTPQEIEKEFRKELTELLNKYHAKIGAENHYFGYADAGADIRMTVCIDSIWSEEGDNIQEYTEIDLGQYFP